MCNNKGVKTPLCVDKDPYKGRYVCGICNQEIMITPKLQNGAFTWRAVCPKCGTLMAYRGEREGLVEQAAKKFYIKPVETTNNRCEKESMVTSYGTTRL